MCFHLVDRVYRCKTEQNLKVSLCGICKVLILLINVCT